jgi:uncharacterized protein (TIGR03435 family)
MRIAAPRVQATTVAYFFLVAGTVAFSQSPVFEVASVRPSQSTAKNPSVRRDPGGGITAANITLKAVIALAYNVQDFQVSGAPAWTATERYDIIAKAPSTAQKSDTWRMLQALLAERFQLIVRRETKDVPIYELVAAKDGPKFHESQRPPSEADGGFRMAKGQLKIYRASMRDLALLLSGAVGRQVVDRTGIQGKFDLELEWGSEPSSDRPTIFTALPDQLGLKLEAAKGPVEIVTVERVERPTAN